MTESIKNVLNKCKRVYKNEGFVILVKKIIKRVFMKLGRSYHSRIPFADREIFYDEYPKKREELQKLSDSELLSIVRHESHRIEKSVYNDRLDDKKEYYLEKKERAENAIEVLKDRGITKENPTIKWANDILESINNLQQKFVEKNKRAPKKFDMDRFEEFNNFLKERRSVRVWSKDQPDVSELEKIADKMIEAAKWAPNSGNRQAWRFRIITEREEKLLLEELKEQHTVNAPLLIFVGMDRRLYGDVADSETSIYIDAGAAIMQMILSSHRAGLGTCWNHFGDDLIKSRESNKKAYSNFCEELEIPSYIEPIAIICAGKAEFIPPRPSRLDNSSLLLDQDSN